MPEAGRVITGSAGGLRLDAPGPATRPFGDKVKQSLFSIMEAERGDIWSRPTLDLYAGSGAAGIEALSRGAPNAVFVEKDTAAAGVIARNLDHTRLGDRGRVVRRDARAWLAAGTTAIPEAPFGCIILDPPYALAEELTDCLERLGASVGAWGDEDLIVAAKHHWKADLAEHYGGVLQVRQRRFGETALSVYRRDPHIPTGGDR